MHFGSFLGGLFELLGVRMSPKSEQKSMQKKSGAKKPSARRGLGPEWPERGLRSSTKVHLRCNCTLGLKLKTQTQETRQKGDRHKLRRTTHDLTRTWGATRHRADLINILDPRAPRGWWANAAPGAGACSGYCVFFYMDSRTLFWYNIFTTLGSHLGSLSDSFPLIVASLFRPWI